MDILVNIHNIPLPPKEDWLSMLYASSYYPYVPGILQEIDNFCAYNHLPYSAQLKLKRTLVKEITGHGESILKVHFHSSKETKAAVKVFIRQTLTPLVMAMEPPSCPILF